ncbi:MAG: site-specific DNA-methyltransferase [Xanthobacteraceae bacterium]|jgi:adenine-specific DNA-methyltransferase
MPKKPDEPHIERIAAQSPDMRAQLREQLGALVPEAFAEGKLDADKLKALLGENGDAGPERYSFSWAGKRDAIGMLQLPTRATLVPDRDNSVNFDEAQHVFIEGENLEVLKVLYRSYFGRVKMIYIDPPYNTGNDFIYPDDFADPLDHYLRITGQKNGNGDYTTSQVDRNGRIHSAWLSMMYPRLALARQFLREDGVIFVSIDDNEARNLRRLLDEVFGEENFIAQLVWEKGRKNDAKLFSIGHEYMLVYAKSLSRLKENGAVWREPKPGAQEIWQKYLELREKHKKDDGAIENSLQNWYRDLPKSHPSKALSRYRHVDKHGPWRDRDISWPGGGGPRYNVPHPKTGKPCKIPDSGWRFSTPEAMQRQIALGLVEFRETENDPPFRKAHLRPIPDELAENGDAPFDDESDTEDEGSIGLQVMPSVIYKQSQVAVKYLKGLMGEKVFDNPKDHEVLARLIRYIGVNDKDVVLDFFAGVATTAEATLLANAQDGGKRRCILVQLPEAMPPSSAIAKKGFKTLAAVARERFKKAVEAHAPKKELSSKEPEPSGFKAFALSSSNIRPWTGVAEKDTDALATQIEAFADSLVPDWKPENVVWETALREGYSLTSRIEKISNSGKQNFWRVTDPEREQSFVICLDDTLTLDAVRALKLKKDSLFVCRDAALDDTLSANLALQCRLKVL